MVADVAGSTIVRDRGVLYPSRTSLQAWRRHDIRGCLARHVPRPVVKDWRRV